MADNGEEEVSAVRVPQASVGGAAAPSSPADELRGEAAGIADSEDEGFVRRPRNKKKSMRQIKAGIAGEDADKPLAAKRKRPAAKPKVPKAAGEGGGEGEGASGSGSSDDDDDDEEDDEDEDEEERERNVKRRRIARYLDIEAEEGDEEDDEEDGYAGKTAEELARYRAARERELRAEADAVRRRREAERSAADIAADLEARYRDSGYHVEDEDEEGGVSGELLDHSAYQQANLPDMRDPKLWMLRCKDGAEVEIMIALLNKWVVTREAGNDLGIFSAVCTARSTIFVEAYREAQVRAAVSGINDLYGWKPDAIRLVPVSEMTSIVKVTSERLNYKAGQFVRLTRGHYKGDLAEIVAVKEGGARILIRCVPRINLAQYAAPKDGRRGNRFGGAKPPQRFFDAAEIKEASGGTVEVGVNQYNRAWGMEGFDTLGSNFYKNGLLYKEVKPAFITPHGPSPSLDEIDRIRARVEKKGTEGGNGDMADAEELMAAATVGGGRGGSDDAPALVKGDAVVVVKGDLLNLTGRVVMVNPGGTFTMQPTGKAVKELGLTERLEMYIDEVIKTFEVGEHVKVTAGAHKGDTGTVLHTAPVTVKTEGGNASNAPATTWLATLLLDSGHQQIQVFVRDLVRSAEVVTSSRGVEGYEMYDFVEVPSVGAARPDAGVIVGLAGQRDVSVLLTSGAVRVVPVNQLLGKINWKSTKAEAIDVMGVPVHVGDTVRVDQDLKDLKGVSGTVRHIHMSYLFLHNITRQALGPSGNAGMFVVRSRNVSLVGSRIKGHGMAPNSAAPSAGPPGARAPAGIASVGGSMGGRRAGPDAMVGMTVRVLRGIHKGKLGIAKAATATHVQVEMHSYQKNVTMPRADVVVVGDRSGARSGGAIPAAAPLGGPRPAFGSLAVPAPAPVLPGFAGAGGAAATPGYAGMGGMTPGYSAGGMTPGYSGMGGQTPGYAGMGAAASSTPAYGSGGMTPAYTGQLGGQTPAYAGMGGQTPAYAGMGGQTPSSRVGLGDFAYGGGAGGLEAAGGGASALAGVYMPPGMDATVPWYQPRSRVTLVSAAGLAGPRGEPLRDGQQGTVVEVLLSVGSAKVVFDGTSGMVTVPLRVLVPVAPSEGTAGGFALVLAGSLAGRTVRITTVDQDEAVTDNGDILPAASLVVVTA